MNKIITKPVTESVEKKTPDEEADIIELSKT